MFRLRVALGDLENDNGIEDGQLTFGGSEIEPFRSPHLFSSLTVRDRTAICWVGEGEDPLAEGRDRPTPDGYRTFRPFEGAAVFLHLAEKAGAMEIARTATGGCPIYVSVEGGVLTASWRFEDAVRALAVRRPDVDACRRYLEHGTAPVRNMVIRGVYMLWPGESLRYDGDRLVFHEVDEPAIVMSGSLSDHARATDEFVRLIGRVLERKLDRSASTLVELSGGMDSSCVAVAASAVRRPLSSYGLIHDGAMGAQQRARRQELAAICELRDAEYPSGRLGPFASLSLPDAGFTPFDDIFRSACLAGVENHPDGPFDLIVTGIGGDELTMEHTFFRHEGEVKGHSALSSISAAAGRCEMFMRMGMWVSQPLIHPDVVDFCRALPERLRKDRMLNLMTLARAGLSDGFLFHRFQEHYGNMVQHEAALFDFEKAIAQSRIAALGISDPGPLLSQAYEAGYGGFSYDLIAKLFLYLKLDAVLTRYLD